MQWEFCLPHQKALTPHEILEELINQYRQLDSFERLIVINGVVPEKYYAYVWKHFHTADKKFKNAKLKYFLKMHNKYINTNMAAFINGNPNIHIN